MKPGASNSQISLYALELSVPGKSGTFGPFYEIWQGKGDRARGGRLRMTNGSGGDPGGDRLLQLLDLDDEPSACAEKPVPRNGERPPERLNKEKRELQVNEDIRFEYALKVSSHLHGRLRMRCWSKGEDRPSVYSMELKLPRGDNLPAVAGGSRRVGPPPSNNYWGPQKEPPKDFGADKLASIPYDVPRARAVNGLAKAGLTLHHLYEGALGIPGGGSGLCFGLRIDHVLLAIVEGDISATVGEPLMALMEVHIITHSILK